MKLFSKEALVLGGLYCCLDTPFSLLGFETISNLLGVLFFLFLIMILFNKVPNFLSKLIANNPKTAYYLSSVGWIVYLVLLVFFGFITYVSFFEVSPDLVKNFIFALACGELILALVSLAVAYKKAK